MQQVITHFALRLLMHSFRFIPCKINVILSLFLSLVFFCSCFLPASFCSKSLVWLVTLLLHHVALYIYSSLMWVHCLRYSLIKLSTRFLFLSVVHRNHLQNVSSYSQMSWSGNLAIPFSLSRLLMCYLGLLYDGHSSMKCRIVSI